MTLSGKRILLIGIGFYDYEQAICDELRSLGADVVHFVEEPAAPTALHRRFALAAKRRLRRHHEAILTQARRLPPLDHVLIIKGRTLNPEFLQALRAAHPDARFTAYHWDSVRRSPELQALTPLFDRLLTFDHRDAAALPGFLHRPLFFRPQLADCRDKLPRIEMSFVGWLHHDRLAQIDVMRTAARAHGWQLAVHLSTGRYTALRQGLFAGRDFVHARQLDFADYVQLVSDSATALDLPHPQQSGMTMRCIEVVPGAGRKLITTNPDCVGYDFYNSENIRVIDMDQAEIPEDFLRTPSRPIPLPIADRYSIRSWVLDVLDPDRLADAPPFFVDPAWRR